MVPVRLLHHDMAIGHARIELLQLEGLLPNMRVKRSRMLHAADGDLQGLLHRFAISYCGLRFVSRVSECTARENISVQRTVIRLNAL